ncbi:MAG TPA: sigma-70 family RNA polymerase sigma factor [Bryobacteraceae bacterium]|nr:sigma-70 family RNA polymerase sigma factor [Bryobacteraceae bacterium]
MVMQPGDHGQEFEALTLPHRDALYQSARSMMANAAAAEDAVLETYLQAWKSFSRFQPGTNCRAWLFGILFNVIRHERRKWTSRVSFIEKPEILEQTLAAQPSNHETLADEEILTALREIPQIYSEVVLLSDVQEFSYKEVQEALGIPIGTVMSRLSRGRQLLRSKLAGRAADYGIGGTSRQEGPRSAVAAI